MTKLRVLLVEDSEDDALLVQRVIQRARPESEFKRVDNPLDFEQALVGQRWDVVISDYNMPRFSAPGALAVVRRLELDLPCIIVSGSIGEDAAVATMKAGAADFVMKSSLKRLPSAIDREVREANNRRERRALEEQLRHAQKMEAVGQLAGGVAHDFNNLLTVILSFGQFVLEDLDENNSSRDDVREVIDCAHRAAGLTKQLLAFSRRQIVELRPLDLGHVLVETQKMLGRLLESNIALKMEIEPGLWWVKADPGHLSQVLVNLVVNARDAMPDGGTIGVQARNIQLPGGPHVRLSVSDTGQGMDAVTQERIFEPFFTTKEPGKGTGLGLSTVFGIVNQCGGEIRVVSQVGKGTTFEIDLPRSSLEEAIEEPVRAESHASSAAGSAVLVVEDEEGVRAVARRALSAAGYIVIEAANPREALQRAEAFHDPLHLVVTDMVLPEMNGRDLVAQLQRERPGLLALFTSGYAHGGPAGALNSQSLQGAPYLPKPFTPDLLLDKVRSVLEPRPAR
jgi:two-component system cell cycle sensor histidine kinase/response regulator CckA